MKIIYNFRLNEIIYSFDYILLCIKTKPLANIVSHEKNFDLCAIFFDNSDRSRQAKYS